MQGERRVIVPISERARKYGYLFWPKAADGDVRALLGEVQTVELSFNGDAIGTRTVDWRHRRISVGPRRTRDLPDAVTNFVLDLDGPRLVVTCR